MEAEYAEPLNQPQCKRNLLCRMRLTGY